MFWCKKYSICSECQVHFEPITGDYADRCMVHRKPLLDLAARKAGVMRWASQNWEELESRATIESAAIQAAYLQTIRAGINKNTDLGMASGTSYGGIPQGGTFV